MLRKIKFKISHVVLLNVYINVYMDHVGVTTLVLMK